MALDIDNWESAAADLALHGIDLRALYDAPDAVQISSGREGHGKLLYAMPFGLALPSKKIKRGNITSLELRCATLNGLTVQDVIPPSIHPITQRPYQWAGKGNWQRLPTIPIPLLDYWNQLLKQDSERIIKATGEADASWDEIKAALFHIPASINRDDWINIGMALHYAGAQTNQLEHALLLWDEWSAQSIEKYKGQQDILACWQSFKADPNGIKLGTLFKLAYEHGYQRPMPDVSTLFSAIEVASPDHLVGNLVTPAPDLNLDLLPPTLARRATELSESIGSDPIVSVLAGYGAICAAADARMRLEIAPGWQVPPVLWLMTIGDPAEKKSPASKPMFSILDTLEKEGMQNYAAELLMWEAHEAAHASSKKAFNLAAADPNTILTGQLDHGALPSVHPLPPKPVTPRLTITDVTSQKMARMVCERPRGLLCHLDEMKSWADKLTDKSSGEDRSCWTTSYEAGVHRMDRVGDGKGEGSYISENFAVAIYGNMQPTVFKSKMVALSDDGLLQRFIPATLRSHFTKVGEPIPDMLTNRLDYEQMIRTIYSINPMTYRLSKPAYDAFREFQFWYEKTKTDERLLSSSDHYMRSYGKLEGTCGRLILLNHLALTPYQVEVSLETTQKSIEIIKNFVVPSLRHVFGEVAGLTADSLEYWLIEHIIHVAGEIDSTTLSELRRSARRRKELEGKPAWIADQLVRDALTPLLDAGWVAITREDRNSVQIAINPSLATLFTERRRSILLAKQRRADHRTRLAGVPRQLVKGYNPDVLDNLL
jgi:hypothetical protein